MPQLQTLVLTDGKTTPVNHTFVPQNINQQGVATVVESSGVPIGDSRVTVSMNRTAEGRYKPLLKLMVPQLVTEVINGVSVPKVARTAYAEIHLNFAPDSSESERNDVVAMVRSALAADKDLVHKTLVKLEGIY